MRIFAKKCFKFEMGGQQFTTRPLIFDEMPAELSKCALFQWALKDGDIEIIDNIERQKRREKDPGKPTAVRAPKPPKILQPSGDAE